MRFDRMHQFGADTFALPMWRDDEPANVACSIY